MGGLEDNYVIGECKMTWGWSFNGFFSLNWEICVILMIFGGFSSGCLIFGFLYILWKFEIVLIFLNDWNVLNVWKILNEHI